jgi:Arc/MetJ-type ribon-helix-helix transcriptional regulator
VTFSVTQEIDQDIDDLVLNCRVARANRSVILKAAIRHLKTMPAEELHKVVREEIS